MMAETTHEAQSAIVIGLNQGMQPIAGYNYGAQKYDRLIGVVKRAMLVATVFTTCGFLIGQFVAESFATLFAKDAPELIATATKGLHVATLFFPIIGMQIVSTAFFQSIGMPGKSIFLSLTRQLIFLLPAILILPHVFNDKVLGVWTALPTADCASCVVSAIMMVVQLRKFRRKAELAKEQAALQPEAE